MPLTDAEFLCAVQTAPTPQLRDEFAERFGGFLRHAATNQCVWRGIRLSEIEAVIDETVMMIFNPEIARFVPSGNWMAYVQGLVQNAAKYYLRFIYNGASIRHDWSAQENVDRGLPVRIEDVEAEDHPEREVAAEAIRMANAEESALVHRHFFLNESFEEIAQSLGIDRSTVSRRLGRFCLRMRLVFSE